MGEKGVGIFQTDEAARLVEIQKVAVPRHVDLGELLYPAPFMTLPEAALIKPTVSKEVMGLPLNIRSVSGETVVTYSDASDRLVEKLETIGAPQTVLNVLRPVLELERSDLMLALTVTSHLEKKAIDQVGATITKFCDPEHATLFSPEVQSQAFGAKVSSLGDRVHLSAKDIQRLDTTRDVQRALRDGVQHPVLAGFQEYDDSQLVSKMVQGAWKIHAVHPKTAYTLSDVETVDQRLLVPAPTGLAPLLDIVKWAHRTLNDGTPVPTQVPRKAMVPELPPLPSTTPAIAVTTTSAVDQFKRPTTVGVNVGNAFLADKLFSNRLIVEMSTSSPESSLAIHANASIEMETWKYHGQVYTVLKGSEDLWHLLNDNMEVVMGGGEEVVVNFYKKGIPFPESISKFLEDKATNLVRAMATAVTKVTGSRIGVNFEKSSRVQKWLLWWYIQTIKRVLLGYDVREQKERRLGSKGTEEKLVQTPELFTAATQGTEVSGVELLRRTAELFAIDRGVVREAYVSEIIQRERVLAFAGIRHVMQRYRGMSQLNHEVWQQIINRHVTKADPKALFAFLEGLGDEDSGYLSNIDHLGEQIWGPYFTFVEQMFTKRLGHGPVNGLKVEGDVYLESRNDRVRSLFTHTKGRPILPLPTIRTDYPGFPKAKLVRVTSSKRPITLTDMEATNFYVPPLDRDLATRGQIYDSSKGWTYGALISWSGGKVLTKRIWLTGMPGSQRPDGERPPEDDIMVVSLEVDANGFPIFIAPASANLGFAGETVLAPREIVDRTLHLVAAQRAGKVFGEGLVPIDFGVRASEIGVPLVGSDVISCPYVGGTIEVADILLADTPGFSPMLRTIDWTFSSPSDHLAYLALW